ncbi:Thioredoxin-like protein CITRX, chloroplastic isoform B [Glycine soja]|uniref:Thioredoxin-like protein CITRX, chloroplastic isoform B n=1 Tax=Glycine soja TaxID=3848 RepID=A0A445I3L4_GLYSO|nr:Thioredoxin-like protein CITRX, chloroplastic isoform B [Glycine soja]
MSLFHCHAFHHRMATLSPFSTFNSKPLFAFLPNPSFLTHHHQQQQHPYPLTKTTTTDLNNNRPLSLSTLPRKLLCKPPQGKYVREDYLVKKLSAQEIQELVKGERKVPLIIDFFATWCGPCILMAQELETVCGSIDLAVEYQNKALIVKVDTDEEYEFARDMQVRGLPTVFFISPDPNKEAIRTEGLVPIQMMRDIIDKDM